MTQPTAIQRRTPPVMYQSEVEQKELARVFYDDVVTRMVKYQEDTGGCTDMGREAIEKAIADIF